MKGPSRIDSQFNKPNVFGDYAITLNKKRKWNECWIDWKLRVLANLLGAASSIIVLTVLRKMAQFLIKIVSIKCWRRNRLHKDSHDSVICNTVNQPRMKSGTFRKKKKPKTFLLQWRFTTIHNCVTAVFSIKGDFFLKYTLSSNLKISKPYS
jgi:hypothetical protein